MKSASTSSTRAITLALLLCAAAVHAVAQAAPPPKPAPGAPDGACKERPKVCAALRRAAAALVEAARENRRAAPGNYICTAAPGATPSCGTTPPQVYLRRQPVARPLDVEEGLRIFEGWYLQNNTCENLCTGRADAAQCQKDCGDPNPPR